MPEARKLAGHEVSTGAGFQDYVADLM